jgi:Chaperone of endosialidase
MRTTTSPVRTSRGRAKQSGFAFILIALGLGSLAFPHMAQAVTPAPDGGYPGGNTAEGQQALLSLATGGFNTAAGFLSLRSDTTGSFNTAIGAGTLLANTADQNTATGAGALLSNTTGAQNTANGAFTLFANTTGQSNCAFGANALLANSTGSYNIAFGLGALAANTIGGQNIAIGFEALGQATSGVANIGIGDQALPNNATGQANIALGSAAGASVTSANHVICIGAGVSGQNVDNSCYIGNIWNQPGGSQAVYVNSDGKLGALVSSRRFKDEIQPMEHASEVIYALKPVSFRYKPEIEPMRPLGFGLIAEDVEKVSPNLVVRDKEGKPFTVRYDQVNAMLLNEVLKTHRKMEDQQKQIDALTSELKKHATLIQKVRFQVGLNRSSPQMALNKQ